LNPIIFLFPQRTPWDTAPQRRPKITPGRITATSAICHAGQITAAALWPRAIPPRSGWAPGPAVGPREPQRAALRHHARQRHGDQQSAPRRRQRIGSSLPPELAAARKTTRSADAQHSARHCIPLSHGCATSSSATGEAPDRHHSPRADLAGQPAQRGRTPASWTGRSRRVKTSGDGNRSGSRRPCPAATRPAGPVPEPPSATRS
jgi:hypothetical protein